MDFEDWDTGVMTETQDSGAAIDCSTTQAQDDCDAASDCEYYGNDENNITNLTTDYLAYESTDQSLIDRFTSSGYIDLDLWTESYLHTACVYEVGGSCLTGSACVDTDACEGAVFWVGKAYVKYYYPSQLPATETIQFWDVADEEWQNSVPRHSPPDVSIADWKEDAARVQGAGSGCTKVQVWFDRMEGYYVAGFKNLHETCDVTVLITAWWLRWKLQLPGS
jgi:hypothetical protein